MARFFLMEFQHYTGDDEMFENFDATDWTPLTADTFDDALQQTLTDMRLYHPHVKRWEKLTERTPQGDELACIWVEAPHAHHYLQLGDLAQDTIWLFALTDHPISASYDLYGATSR